MSSENIIHCIQDVHVKELVKRLNWSVTIRWYYISISAMVILCVYFMMDQQAMYLHYDYLIGALIYLFVFNTFYHFQQRFTYDKCLGTHELRNYLILQIVNDYLALMVVVYALGTIETPIILMIIPNSILSTLFFTRKQSLLITVLGLLLVIFPLLLEYFQLIPVISIFEESIKQELFASPVILMGYLAIYFAGVIFCWYLLSSITSQLIRNELELEQSYQDMIRLDKEKTHATLRSTHELKAPLAAIKSYVYTLDSGYVGEINDKVIKVIKRIGLRCDFLLDNVTDMIKVGNLKSYVVSDNQFHAINIVKFVKRLAKHLHGVALQKEITFKFTNNLFTQTPTIMANEDNLNLIFNNLLYNAINYSHENSQIEIKFNQKGQQICVNIIDHGIGIEEKYLDKIFEEHFRTNRAVQFHEGGTGLGLSIVKLCCRIVGADIQLKSTLNEGTTAIVCFNKMGDKDE